MRKRIHSLTRVRAALTTLAAVALTAAYAQGSTMSFTFSQGGWSDAAGDTGTLTGSFTGTPELNGVLMLAELTSFQAQFQESGPLGSNTFIFNLPNTTDFTYDPFNGLDFAAGNAASGIQLCSGGPDTNAICFGISPQSGAATNFSGFFDDLPRFQQTTTHLGVIVTPLGSGTATAPEPGGLGLFVAAGILLIGVGVCRKGLRREV
jgi:hypothetical protein